LVRGRADVTATLTADTANWAPITITPSQAATISGDMPGGSGTSVSHVPGPGGQAVSLPGSYIVALRKTAGGWEVSALAAKNAPKATKGGKAK
jgi:ketosteroid isomerase-like protein